MAGKDTSVWRQSYGGAAGFLQAIGHSKAAPAGDSLGGSALGEEDHAES